MPRFFLRNVTAGILAGDDYDIGLCAEPGARVEVGPTAATQVFTMPGQNGARSRLRLEVHEGAVLRYDAGVAILQRGSALDQSTELVVHPGGALAYQEVVALGRLAHGERLLFRRYAASLSIVTPGGRALYRERCDLRPEIEGVALDMAVGGHGVMATLVLTGVDMRSPGSPSQAPGMYAGVTALPNGAGTLIRVLARRVEDATRVLEDCVAT